MKNINNAKYNTLTAGEMNAISGGKKEWKYDSTEWIQIDCPGGVTDVHPNATCWDTTQTWNLVNGRGKVFDTQTRDDSHLT